MKNIKAKIKQKFEEDPITVIYVSAIAVTAAAGIMTAVARNVEASAYAYRASKLK